MVRTVSLLVLIGIILTCNPTINIKPSINYQVNVIILLDGETLVDICYVNLNGEETLLYDVQLPYLYSGDQGEIIYFYAVSESDIIGKMIINGITIETIVSDNIEFILN